MRYKYGALFVLYNPSHKELETIAAVSGLFDSIYIYDNSEKEDHGWAFIDRNIRYISYKSNDGLSKAYNRVLSIANEDNIDWLSIFDQDSEVTMRMVNALMLYAEECDASKIATICPYIQYGQSNILCNETMEVRWAINSGQMLNVKNITRRNIEFDENLFLDRVDRDFCKQIEKKQLKIVRVKNAVMKQNLGEKYKGATVHSPLRNYYICKNRLYYNRKYYGFFRAVCLSALQTTRHFFYIIKVGKDVKDNIYMMCKGIKDYSLGRMSKYDGTM